MRITSTLHPQLPSRERPASRQLDTELEVVKGLIDGYVTDTTVLGAIPLGGAAAGILRTQACLESGHSKAAAQFALSSALNLAGAIAFGTGFFLSDPVVTGCGAALVGLSAMAANNAAHSHVAAILTP